MKERNKNEQLQQAAVIQQPLAVAGQKKPNEKDEFSFELGNFSWICQSWHLQVYFLQELETTR